MDTCPKCGAERGTGLSAGAFTCGSYIQANRKVYQCKTCRVAELEKEVERLQTTYAVHDYDCIAYVGNDPVDAAAHIKGNGRVQVWRHGKRQYKEES